MPPLVSQNCLKPLSEVVPRLREVAAIGVVVADLWGAGGGLVAPLHDIPNAAVLLADAPEAEARHARLPDKRELRVEGRGALEPDFVIVAAIVRIAHDFTLGGEIHRSRCARPFGPFERLRIGDGLRSTATRGIPIVAIERHTKQHFARAEGLCGIGRHIAHPADRRDRPGVAARVMVVVRHEHGEIHRRRERGIIKSAAVAGGRIARLADDRLRDQFAGRADLRRDARHQYR